jgi:hypothetical protein
MKVQVVMLMMPNRAYTPPGRAGSGALQSTITAARRWARTLGLIKDAFASIPPMESIAHRDWQCD